MRNGLSYWRGNIIKYVMRAGHKTVEGKTEKEAEIDDLKKAIRYLTMRINQLNGEIDLWKIKSIALLFLSQKASRKRAGLPLTQKVLLNL